MAEKLKTLRLILGDQLNHHHSWFKDDLENTTYVFMEMRQETDYVVHHIQKVVGFFSAMRNFENYLEERDHKVIYLKINDKKNKQDLKKNLDQLISD
ncbi:MAG: cryptochrome/photolyase family protein, partial [Christiangramia sp.]|nr:cryptochrome/photolyase family protein [Christiangramia sp.]